MQSSSIEQTSLWCFCIILLQTHIPLFMIIPKKQMKLNSPKQIKEEHQPIIQQIFEDSIQQQAKQKIELPIYNNNSKEILSKIDFLKKQISNKMVQTNQQSSQMHNQISPQRKSVVSQDQLGQINPFQLVDYYRQKKKELQKSKKSEAYKIIINLKNQFGRSQRHRDISQRLTDFQGNKEKTNSIDIKDKSFGPFLNKKRTEKISIDKPSQGVLQNQRSISINYPIKRHKKSKWAEQLEYFNLKDKQQANYKISYKKMSRIKRFKYGQLINNVINPSRMKTQHQNQSKQKYRSIQKIDNKKTKTDNYSMMNLQPKSVKSSIQSLQNQPSIQSIQQQKEKKKRQYMIRRQTRQRLKRIESKSITQISTKHNSSYENYLGLIKSKNENFQHLGHLIQNDSLPRQQKCKLILKKALAFENRAKLREEVKRKKDEESDDLYMNSIKAKLMILQHLQT